MVQINHPDLILYGIYLPGVEGPQANFISKEDAIDWAYWKWGEGKYYILTNYARWMTKEEEVELDGNTAK